MAKVHLVDGTFELFRCFHGAPRHANAGGEEVGAVRGLLHTLLSLLKSQRAGIEDPDPIHAAVAFDPLPAARGPASDDPGTLIRRQSALAMEAVRALGIPLWPMVRFQADDALATGARVLREDIDVDQVVLCTTDTDLFQCIRGRRVVVLDRIRKAVYRRECLPGAVRCGTVAVCRLPGPGGCAREGPARCTPLGTEVPPRSC